jgi:salicylate hydroxylase
MRLGAKVMACDPEEGTISLISGEVVRADLILGTDGIHVRVVFSVLYATDNSSSRLFVLT